MLPKCLFIIDSLQTGGAEKSILAIASQLKLFKPVVVVVYQGLSLLPEYEQSGLRVITLNLTGKYNFIEAIKAFKEVVKTEKPDLVHATLFRSEVVARFCLCNSSIPLLGSFVNDSYSPVRYSQLSFSGRFKLNIIKLVDRFTAKWSTHFMSITNAIIANNARALRIDPSKVTVIYRGRDVDEPYIISEADKLEFRNIYGGDYTFLSVARLLIRKGLKESIEAFAHVIKRNQNARYLIAGEGHDRPVFEESIKRLGLEGKVFLLGTRNDVSALLAYADAFIFPSHYEGQGGALVEAMLAAKPIIGSDIAVVAESIQDNYSGLLFRLRNSTDLAKKMLWVTEYPEEAKQLGYQAREVALKRFNVDEVAKQHEELYLRVIEGFKSRN
jgi:glycosyltransferase involved in cell wall biosynthesis